MFGGDQRRSRNPQWTIASGQQDEAQRQQTQPTPSTSGLISGAPSYYDPDAVGQQPQSSLDDHQWLHSTATQQYPSGLGTGAYSVPYRQQQPQSSRALLHESFSRQQHRTPAQSQQQTVPHLLNQYNFVAPQYQPPQQTQFPLDQSAAPGYRPQVPNEPYLYGQIPSNPAQNAQNASRVEDYPYSQQFQFFNSPLSELANNATSSSSSSELLAYPPPHGPSVSPAISDRSTRQNTSGPTPPPPPTSTTPATGPVVAAAESNTARNKAPRTSKKRKSAKRPRIAEDSTTDTEEEDIIGSGASFSIHLTQPPRGSEFVFPTRL